MTSELARRRRRLALSSVIALLLGLGIFLGSGPSRAHGAGTRAGNSASSEPQGLERFDLVGEKHTGPLRVTLAGGAFPNRILRLTMPSRSSLAASDVHVFEDGQDVGNVVLDSLGSSGTSSAYRARYLSIAPTAAKEVELSVTVDGVGVADVDYSTPASRALVPLTAHHSFWSSGLGLVAAAFGAAALFTIALIALLMPRRRRSELRRRVAHFTRPIAPQVVEPDEAPEAKFPVLERLLAKMTWWPRFREEVEIARMGHTAVELVVFTVILTVVIAFLAAAAIGFPAVAIIVLPIGPFLLNAVVRGRLSKQQEKFREQLAPHLEELASAMRAGHGLTSGLAAMTESAVEPSRGEWSRVVADEQLGRPLEAAMHSMAKRMNCTDIEQVALVAALHGRTGGNMAEVLERVAEGVRERAELHRELKALTAQARLSRWVVSLLPPALIALVTAMNHNYMKPLFTTRGGIIMLGIAFGLLVAGSLVMRKLTDIKV